MNSRNPGLYSHAVGGRRDSEAGPVTVCRDGFPTPILRRLYASRSPDAPGDRFRAHVPALGDEQALRSLHLAE